MQSFSFNGEHIGELEGVIKMISGPRRQDARGRPVTFPLGMANDRPLERYTKRMLPTERIEDSSIAERPPLKLSDGARIIVWVIVNVEEWDPQQPMPRTVLTPPTGGSPMPDVLLSERRPTRDSKVCD
jgi:hypothetical protein